MSFHSNSSNSSNSSNFISVCAVADSDFDFSLCHSGYYGCYGY